MWLARTSYWTQMLYVVSELFSSSRLRRYNPAIRHIFTSIACCTNNFAVLTKNFQRNTNILNQTNLTIQVFWLKTVKSSGPKISSVRHIQTVIRHMWRVANWFDNTAICHKDNPKSTGTQAAHSVLMKSTS